MLIPFKLNSAEMMVKGMDSKIMIATDAHAQLDFFNFCFTDVSFNIFAVHIEWQQKIQAVQIKVIWVIVEDFNMESLNRGCFGIGSSFSSKDAKSNLIDMDLFKGHSNNIV